MAEQQRVVGGTMRPDGTMRKERRVRPGYIPQDEQQVYQSAGRQWVSSVPRCPGLDEATAAAIPSGAPKSKAARKNEKRKAKKDEDKGAGGDVADGVTQQLQQLSTSDRPSSSRPAASAAAAGGAPAPGPAPASDDPAALLEKQIRALQKKIRQCDALVTRSSGGGDPLTAQEEEKLAKVPGWQEEVAQLEHQLRKLRGA